jgi:Tol biopolymer transport system component
VPRSALPEELSFTADNGVWLVRRDGTRQRLVEGRIEQSADGMLRTVYGISGVEWSPDGSKLLAFRQSSAPALVVVRGNGTVGATIAAGASLGRWSPDGTRIAFIRPEAGAGYAIFVTSSEGTGVTRVASFAQFDRGSFSWSPDGTRIVYAGRRDTGLFVAHADGRSAPRRIPLPTGTGVAEANWSPDGSQIAFRTGGRIRVVRLDGTGLRSVGAAGSGIAWSPRGALIAFMGRASRQRPARTAVHVVRSDGADHRLAGTCACTLRGPGFWPSFAWSSDGSRIAYVSGKGNTVSTVRPDGSGAVGVAGLARRGRHEALYPWWPLWRPHG